MLRICASLILALVCQKNQTSYKRNKQKRNEENWINLTNSVRNIVIPFSKLAFDSEKSRFFFAFLSVEQSSLSSCLPCPPGKYCAGIGLIEPNGNCSAGYICYNGSTEAQPGNMSFVKYLRS